MAIVIALLLVRAGPDVLFVGFIKSEFPKVLRKFTGILVPLFLEVFSLIVDSVEESIDDLVDWISILFVNFSFFLEALELGLLLLDLFFLSDLVVELLLQVFQFVSDNGSLDSVGKMLKIGRAHV